MPQIDPDVPDLVNPIITKLMDHIIDSKSSEQDVIDNSERFLSRFRKELNNKRECNVQKLSNDYTGDLERTENGIRDFSQGSTDAPSVVVPWSVCQFIPIFSIKDRQYVPRDAKPHLQAISNIIEKHLTGKSGNSGLVNATLKASYVLASVMRPYMDKYIQGIHFQPTKFQFHGLLKSEWRLPTLSGIPRVSAGFHIVEVEHRPV